MCIPAEAFGEVTIELATESAEASSSNDLVMNAKARSRVARGKALDRSFRKTVRGLKSLEVDRVFLWSGGRRPLDSLRRFKG